MQKAAPFNDQHPKLNTRQMAAHLGVSSRTLANWREEGKIPFVRITARCIRYSLAEVEKALGKLKSRL